MNPSDNRKSPGRRRGLALITVISMIALATVLLLAFLTTADSEYNSTRVSADGEAARRLAEDGVALVIGQIQAGSRQVASIPGREFHVTQPGVVRQYRETGELLRAYKLYSDSQMVEAVGGTAGELRLANDAPPGDWNTTTSNNHARYIDMNAPVVRARVNEGGRGQPEVIFPILDPRLGRDDPATAQNDKVEGFEFWSRSKLGTGGEIGGTVEARGGDGANMRIPMPVEWLYVLKDGQMGTLDASLRFVPVPGADSQPSEDNPIVGRVAIWTDDESCKVNINTASEPTFWMPPHFYSERDKNWNDAPPVQYEYQRYPGHPATVALSSVLYPNQDLDWYGKTEAARNVILDIRESLYALAPKINKGGSLSGTRPFDPDDLLNDKSDPITFQDVANAMQERLYVSLDELRFGEDTRNQRRVANSLQISGAERLTPELIERSRFFLTANSRAPEFSMFGVPRIAMWPLPHTDLGPEFRTVWDNMIAFCASTRRGGTRDLFAFQRKTSYSQLDDIEDPRNKILMEYLFRMMGKTYPGTSAGGGSSFLTKYKEDDARQILVEIFDYIRCTNLYDSQLSIEAKEIKERGQSANNGKGTNTINQRGFIYSNPVLSRGKALHGNWTALYEYRDSLRANPKSFEIYTFTDPQYARNRSGDGRVPSTVNNFPAYDTLEDGFPGHGQVSPARWNVAGKDYMGFGRNISVSEVALHFICTADGEPDAYSYKLWNSDFSGKMEGTESGGRTAPRTTFPDDYQANKVYFTTPNRKIHPRGPEEPVRWYSNYPPRPDLGMYGTSENQNDSSNRAAQFHPGFDPKNWNLTLEDKTPLRPNQRRIQCMLQLELFCPSVGWTGIDPEYTFVVSGKSVNGISIFASRRNGGEGWEALYSTTTDLEVKSGRQTYTSDRFASSAHRVGGTAGFRTIVSDRHAKPIGRANTDTGYDSSASARVHGGLINLELMSNFKTVASANPNEHTFRFRVEEPMKIMVYDTHNWKGTDPKTGRQIEPVQVLEIPFPSSEQTALTPSLVTVSTPYAKVVNESTGSETLYASTQAPRWWIFNHTGCVNVMEGDSVSYARSGNFRIKNAGELGRTGVGGRLKTSAFGAASGVPGGSHSDTLNFNLPLNLLDPNANGNAAISTSHMAKMIWGVSGAGSNQFYLNNNTRVNKQFLKDNTKNFGFDIVRSMIPRYGDYRLTAARRVVPKEAWIPHPLWSGAGDNDVIQAHNLSAFSSDAEFGFDQTGIYAKSRSGPPSSDKDFAKYRLVKDADYQTSKIPDLPHSDETMRATHRYQDWDNAIGATRDGAYINKPDEGNFANYHFYLDNAIRLYRSGYLFDSQESSGGVPAYFTPNRMVSSPVLFGSLPTGVFGSNPPVGAGNQGMSRTGVPWRTLLFRPHTVSPSVSDGSQTSHPGGAIMPADHNLLDLFYMPVVEPFAISEPLSQMGRINVNYQILPFTNIKRATGLHAVLKGMLMPAMARNHAPYYKGAVNKNGKWPIAYWSEIQADPQGVVTNAVTTIGPNHRTTRAFHRKINADETVRQLDERFYHLPGSVGSSVGLLRAPGQFCELYLVPQNTDPKVLDVPQNSNLQPMRDEPTRRVNMQRFWDAHSLTGDNMRERPYADIYPRITTRSNTFRVYIRAQSVRKARSVDPESFDPEKDQITGEYRGMRLLERYIDPTNDRSQIPDYAAAPDPYTPQPLDEYYRFRVIEAKRFDP